MQSHPDKGERRRKLWGLFVPPTTTTTHRKIKIYWNIHSRLGPILYHYFTTKTWSQCFPEPETTFSYIFFMASHNLDIFSAQRCTYVQNVLCTLTAREVTWKEKSPPSSRPIKLDELELKWLESLRCVKNKPPTTIWRWVRHKFRKGNTEV